MRSPLRDARVSGFAMGMGDDPNDQKRKLAETSESRRRGSDGMPGAPGFRRASTGGTLAAGVAARMPAANSFVNTICGSPGVRQRPSHTMQDPAKNRAAEAPATSPRHP